MDLAATRRTWVARRIDQFNLIDDRSIQRVIELHLDVSASTVQLPREGSVLLPLFTLERSTHTAMTVKDGAGVIIPRVARSQERRLVAEGILTVQDRIVGDERLLGKVAKLLDQDPVLSRPVGMPSSQPLLPPQSEMDYLVERLADLDVERESIEGIVGEIEEYYRGRLLLASLPVGMVRRPLLLQVMFAQVLPRRPLKSVPFRVLGGTLSMGTKVEVPRVSDADSFHATVRAPTGFRVVDMVMTVTDDNDANAEPRRIVDDDRLPTSGHAFVSVTESARANATVSVSFYSNKSGFLLESWIIALLTSALLGVFSWHFEQVGFIFGGDEAAVSQEVAVTILLLLPAIAITVATQRDGHRISARAFSFHKFLLFLVATSAAAASLAIALQFDPDAAENWWYVACGVCWAVTFRISIASLLHAWRISSVRSRLPVWVRVGRESWQGMRRAFTLRHGHGPSASSF